MNSIDVHHHFYPTSKDNEGRDWSIGAAMEGMDRNGIAVAIGSLPPVHGTASDDGRSQARAWNEWATRLCLDHPGRLGLFASLPLRDIDACITEIGYGFDVLHADGIGLPTSDGDIWLSDARFTPMFAELDRRKAVVFVHPYPTSHCRALSQAYGGDLVSPPWLEFPTNTARTILGLLAKGVTRKFPDIRFIFCHGGGVMPLLLGRIAGFAGWPSVGPEALEAAFPGGIYAGFERLYFDCAQAYAPETFQLMRRRLPVSRLLFGTDFPYFPVSHGVREFANLDMDEDTANAIRGGNAAALFPRFCPALESP